MPYIKEIIKYLEGGNNPFYYYIFTFFSAITLRNFVEFMIVSNAHAIQWHHPVHFSLFYISLCLSIIILLYLITREKVERIARVVAASFIITPIVPAIDLLLQVVWDYEIKYQYMIPEKTESILKNYLLFFGNHAGATPGIRFEIFIAMICCSFYVFYKTSSLLKSLLGAILFYSLVFWGYFAILFSIQGIERLAGLLYDTSPKTMIDTYLFLAIHAFLLVLYFYNRAYMTAVVRDIRLTRILHYEMMVIFGFALGYPDSGRFFMSLSNIMEIYFVVLSVVFAFIFSAITNNIADVTIDKISNPDRPSVTGVIPWETYNIIGFTALFFSIVYSLTAGHMILFLIICFIGVYFLYSMPPLRMKRIPFFSKGFIALNSLIMLLAGYSFHGKEITSFPPTVAVFVLICFTACSNLIDIKDYEGDKAAGIKTLPVILGLKQSKMIIGIFFAVGYASFPYIMKMPDLYAPSIIFGIALLLAINIQPYKDKIVFSLYLLSSISLLGYLIAKNINK